VFNVLLQVLDDGRLTDGQGRTVDFRNTVIVMTSNLGSRIQEMMSEGAMDERGYERVKAEVLSVVVRHFSPEFVNRIDETVVFHPLQQAQIRGIADIQIALLNKRLQDNDLRIEVSDRVLDKIARLGYDPVYGARH
jgi:ATP-dependent Clp protease ATP-binding subunit ClpB